MDFIPVNTEHAMQNLEHISFNIAAMNILLRWNSHIAQR